VFGIDFHICTIGTGFARPEPLSETKLDSSRRCSLLEFARSKAAAALVVAALVVASLVVVVALGIDAVAAGGLLVAAVALLLGLLVSIAVCLLPILGLLSVL
jgi:hypothetical protein